MNESLVQLLRRANALQNEGRTAVACLLVKARGSTPQSAGALMLIDDTSGCFGTIGGGCVEAEVRKQAFSMLSRSETGLLKFKLDHDFGWDDGLICGGTIELAIAPFPESTQLSQIITDIELRKATSLKFTVNINNELVVYALNLQPHPRLYIAGAGHIGQALARLCLTLEYEVSLFDDRGDLLDKFAPEGALKKIGDIAEQLTQAPIDDNTYCVVVTRGHQHDEQALAAIVNRGAKYIGMIGSRRKIKLVFDDLLNLGILQTALDSVHAPIGLDISAETVEEIALSIAAQLIDIRRAEQCTCVTGPIAETDHSAVATQYPESGSA